MRTTLAAVVAVAVVMAGCTGDDGAAEGQPEASGTTEATGETTAAPLADTTAATAETSAAARPISAADAAELQTLADEQPGCDHLDPTLCLLPFPSDRWLVEDPSTDTGLRVAFPVDAMPTNAAGTPIDPTGWNLNDGASPGTTILTHVPGLDVDRSGLPPVTDIGVSLEPTSPTLLFDAESGERVAHWAELDAQAADGETQLLIIHPAVNLQDGHRYVVALRDLKDASGAAIEPGVAFRALRDGGEPPEGVFTDADLAQGARVMAALDEAGVERDGLFLAWDFTVASTRNLTERMLHLRDETFDGLGAEPPTFQVTSVEENPEPFVGRRVRGTFEVPNYLTNDGSPGNSFVLGPDGLPVAQGNSITTSFTCNVPPQVLDPSGPPARASLYGHGLLGSDDEAAKAENVRQMGEEHGMVFCATKWLGMSADDVPNAAAILNDLSRFPTLADRGQEGILAYLLLGRLLKHERGFAADPAFQRADGTPVFDPTEVFYDGNSQGGIMGGAAAAVAQDWTQVVLGVPGMRYALLLPRSVDFDEYLVIMDKAYVDPAVRTLGFGLIQMLWDRAEADGYANHVTRDPLPDTPVKEVLMHVALGDHQVTPVAAEIMARTYDAKVHDPTYAEGRTLDEEPVWGLDPITSYPYDGSAIVIWDSGQPVQPPENVPPTAGEDPHADPRTSPDAREQKSEFLTPEGVVVDVCAAQPCKAAHAG